MKRILLGLSPLLLLANGGSCTTVDAGKPSLNVQTQIVYVDRPVAAVKAADVPVPPCKTVGTPKQTLSACLGKQPADARPALDLALAKLLELIGYVDKADPLLVSAAKQP